MPVVGARFGSIARHVMADMDAKLAAGAGKVSFRDYKIVLERYFIPYFGNTLVSSIDYKVPKKFDAWREQKIGRAPSASTLSTHNSALNRVLDAAVAQGYMTEAQRPTLQNKGVKGERRPAFEKAEYTTLIRKMPAWIDAGRAGKSRDMRYLLRDYVLILANTGAREGSEPDSLKWKNITLWEKDGKPFLKMHVNGKTGPRDLMCRAGMLEYLKRIHARSNDLQHLSFDQLLKQRVDKHEFCLPDGTRTENLRQTFRKLMEDMGLLVCPNTGKNRTLYSLRHTYATFALQCEGMDVHPLAVQMGNSIQMIEKHYRHLTPLHKKVLFTGKRYDFSNEEYQAARAQNTVDTAIGVNAAGSTPTNQAATTVLQNALSPQQSFEDEAFGAFEHGDIDEDELLAMLGVGSAVYNATNNLKTRALKARTSGMLSKAALMKIAA
ncbi:MAG: tyrosine-type recombinase/integrase [Cohaesibacteraceae bacterium]